MKYFNIKNLVIATVGSLGILVFNLVMVPSVGGMFGIQMTMMQAAHMSLFFFVLRVLWLYLVLMVADGKVQG